MFCGLCGTRNSRNNKFCRECGARLAPPAPVQPLPEEAFDILREDSSPADDSSQGQELLDKAFQAYEDHRLEEAQSWCQQALAWNPTSTSAHSLLALIYEKQGDLPRALQEYEIVLEINPDSPADRARRARLRGETAPRREDSAPARVRWPKRVPAWAWMAGSLLLILICSVLIAWGHRAAEKTAVLNLLAQGKTHLAQQRYSEAADCFRQALALDPHHEEAQRLETAVARALTVSGGNSALIRPLPDFTAPEGQETAPRQDPPMGPPPPGSVLTSPPPGSPPRVASVPGPATSPRPARPSSNIPVQGGTRGTSGRLSAIPSASIPSPLVGSDRVAFLVPAEADSQRNPTSSVSRFPFNPPQPAVRASQPQQYPGLSPDPPPEPPREESYIRISVKDAPSGSRSPRPTEPTPKPEPAPRPNPGALPGTQPTTAKRDLRAEAEAHEARALRLSVQGDYQGAIRAYQQALETAPDSPRSGRLQQGIGLCYQKLKQHHQALSSLRKAEQKLASQSGQEGADRATQRALQATREAIKASEEHVQEEAEGK